MINGASLTVDYIQIYLVIIIQYILSMYHLHLYNSGMRKVELEVHTF